MATRTASLTWLRDQTFIGQALGATVLIDNPAEGAERRGASPVDLALMALASCTAVDVVAILEKQRQALTGLTIHVEGERAPDHPRRYTRVTMTFEVHGRGLSEAAVRRAIELSDEKYCSVSATFREPVEVKTAYRIVDAATGDGPAG